MSTHSYFSQGSKKYRTYDRAVVAKQGCFEDAHVSELIIPHNWKDTGMDRYLPTSLRKFDSSDFGYYELWRIWSWRLWTSHRYLWIWRHQSLEIAVLEVASFGGYGLWVFNTHPISMTSRTGVDTVIQPSCSMCITRFRQNISKIWNRTGLLLFYLLICCSLDV